MRQIERVTVLADPKVLKEILSSMREIKRVTYRKEFWFSEGEVVAHLRMSAQLYDRLQTELEGLLVLNCVTYETQEHEIKPFKRLIRIDVYELGKPEEFLAMIKKEFNPCEEWLVRLTKLVAVNGGKKEIVHKLKLLLKEIEGEEE